MNRRSTVLFRALVSNVALSALMVIVLLLLMMGLVRQSFRQQLQLRASAMAEFIAAQSQYPLLVADRRALIQLAESALGAEDVVMVRIDGGAGTEPVNLIRQGGDAEPGETVQVQRAVFAPAGDGLFGFSRDGIDRKPLGTVRVAFSAAQQDALFRRIVWSAAGLSLVVLAAAMPLQFFDLKRVLAPLAALSRFAGKVGAGDLDSRAPVARSDEIGELTLAFNRMLDRLSNTTVSRDYVDGVIRCMAESLVVVGANGEIRTVNQATLDLLAYREDELLGRHAGVICMAERPGAGTQESGMSVYRDRAGTEIPVLFSRAPLRVSHAGAAGEVWMAQDMTQRQKEQQELLLAKEKAESASRAKSLFLATMSHELRTPLNAMLGFTQLMQVEMEDRCVTQWSADLEKIERAGQLLLGLINNILDLSRIDAGRMDIRREPVDIGAAVREAAEDVEPLVARNRNRLTVEADPGMVSGDSMRIRQCLINLVGNACKFTDHGEIRVEGVACENEYRIHVADTGIGIEPADLERLFSDFTQVDASTTRKFGGSGLGLAISRRFARLMDGDITAESTPGRGSVFTLKLKTEAALLETVGESCGHRFDH